jgi:hypothetical protein
MIDCPPDSTASSRKTPTLIAMRTRVSMGTAFVMELAVYTFWAPAFVHSGQWNPTEAWCMQRGQIGRSHRWQTTPAGVSGWR